MKKYFAFALALAVLITMTGCRRETEQDASASGSNKETAKVQSETAEKMMPTSASENGAEQKTMKFERTVQAEQGKTVHYYRDEEQNQYIYDEQDRLVGFIPSAVTGAAKTKVDEAQAITAATKVMETFLGDTAADFEYDKTLFTEDTAVYHVSFSKTYPDSIQVGTCTVNLTQYGGLKSVSLNYDDNIPESERGVLEQADLSAAEKEVEALAQKYLKKLSSEFASVDYKITDVSMVYEQEVYCLRAIGEIELLREGHPKGTGMIFSFILYYDIENKKVLKVTY